MDKWTRKEDFAGWKPFDAVAGSLGGRVIIGTGASYDNPSRFYGDLKDFWMY